MQHYGYSDNVVTGRALSAILFFEGPHLELDNIAVHFSDFWLSLLPVLHRDLGILPSNRLTVGVNGGIISQPSKRPRLLQPSEISQLIVDTDSDKARVSRDISSVEGGSESVPGVSNSTVPPNSQSSRVQQFNFIQCI
jgi:hypothetical protein